MVNITALSTGTRVYFADLYDDSKEKVGMLECDSTVDELRTAIDTVHASKTVTLSVYPNNNTARTPVSTSMERAAIAYAMATSDGLRSWVIYDQGFKLSTKKVLVDHTIVELEALFDEGALVDYDGNVYTTVTIGNQEWTVENLRVTHYSDGTDIPNLPLAAAWVADTEGAYCWYNNDASNMNPYGALYNWYAGANAHGLVYFERGGVQEVGWRLPTIGDGIALMLAMGADLTTAGGLLKETGTFHWLPPNVGATDAYGLKIIGSGNRYIDNPLGDGFASMFIYGDYMLSDETDALTGTSMYAYYDDDDLHGGTFAKLCGYAVRCVRDV